MPVNGWPDKVWSVPYLSSAIPGSNTPTSWMDGSNCQRFAYGVLALFGLTTPMLRSAELWSERSLTQRVVTPMPLDLVLYNAHPDPWGAHVGVWMGPDEVFHLCREVGTPVTWTPDEFRSRRHYSSLIGIKRVLGTRLNAPLLPDTE
jgi:hypothetical protein